MKGSFEFMANGSQKFTFEAVGFIEGKICLSQFIDLEIEVLIGFFELILHANQASKHSVEGMAQVLKFVPGLDFTADIQFSGTYGITHLF